MFSDYVKIQQLMLDQSSICVFRCEIKFCLSDEGIILRCRHEIFVQHEMAEVSKNGNTNATYDECDFW